MPLLKYTIIFIAILFSILCIAAFKNFNGGSFLSNNLFYPIAIWIEVFFIFLLVAVAGFQYYFQKFEIFHQLKISIILSIVIFILAHILIVNDVWHKWERNEIDKKFLKNFRVELDSINKAIVKDPDNYKLYFNRALLIKSNNKEYDYRDIIIDLEKAWALNPNDYQTNVELSNYYSTDDQFGKKYYQKVNLILLDSLSKRIIYNPSDKYAYMDRGTLKEKTGDSTGAILDYEKVFTLDPQIYDVAFKLGDFYFKKGDLEKSDYYYKNGVLNDFSYDPSKDLTFQILMKKGFRKRYILMNYEAALIDFLQAFKIYPKDKEVINEIAWIYENLGNKSESEKYLKLIN